VIIVDRALETRARTGNPIRVALIGAGFMGRAIAVQIARHVAGMEVVAIANRHVAKARDAFAAAGLTDVLEVDSPHQLARALAEGRRGVTEAASVVCEADGIDAVIEVTGTVEAAAAATLQAIGNGKHVVQMNAEMDGTVGPILKHHADRAGVIYTFSDGDQPGVEMNLVRFVRGLGMTPRVVGNIKGLLDHYRTPITQAEYLFRTGSRGKRYRLPCAVPRDARVRVHRSCR
jgi:predicted homoserine dehydrogenase-like protein